MGSRLRSLPYPSRPLAAALGALAGVLAGAWASGLALDDLLLLGLVAVYFILVAIDVYVAWRFAKAARRRPFIPALTGIAVATGSVAGGAAIGALLGVSAVWRLATGASLIAQPWGALLLVAALLVPSAGLTFLLRQLRGWDRFQPIVSPAPPAGPPPPATIP